MSCDSRSHGKQFGKTGLLELAYWLLQEWQTGGWQRLNCGTAGVQARIVVHALSSIRRRPLLQTARQSVGLPAKRRLKIYWKYSALEPAVTRRPASTLRPRSAHQQDWKYPKEHSLHLCLLDESLTMWPFNKFFQSIVDGRNRQNGTGTVNVKSRLPGPDELAHLFCKSGGEHSEYLFVLVPIVKRSTWSFIDRVQHNDATLSAVQATDSTKIGIVVEAFPVGVPGTLDTTKLLVLLRNPYCLKS